MLAKRIIPCLDVKGTQVVKGVRFRNHEIIGDAVELALFYSQQGADELVLYDITASSEGRSVATKLVQEVAAKINIPLCVAGGIRSFQDAYEILKAGADKISINSPALERPDLINELVDAFGSQCIVIGVDSFAQKDNYRVYQYTGDEHTMRGTEQQTKDWIKEVQARGAGEIVLNCMNQDGVRRGYDIEQLKTMRAVCKIPLIASGGAGCEQDFLDVFAKTEVDGALAASVFHNQQIEIMQLKKFLNKNEIIIRFPPLKKGD